MDGERPLATFDLAKTGAGLSIPDPVTKMKLLDRYVLRNFLEPFVICFFGFIAIWLIIDLSDNGPDFLDARASLKQVLEALRRDRGDR